MPKDEGQTALPSPEPANDPGTGAAPSRRLFLAGAAAVGVLGAGGGLVLALRLFRRGAPVPPPESGGMRPNAWLEVAPSGRVAIWVAKSEMGQGVHTALAQLVADQLACRWSDVEVRQAPTDMDLFGWQGTFTSSSVHSSWETLGKAGAAAREMLVAAAAAALVVPARELVAQGGRVVHSASGRSLSFGELAAEAAKLAVPRSPAILKAAPGEGADLRAGELVGTSPERADLFPKITGTARFGVDVRWPGMLFAAVARCPFLGPGSRHPFTRGRSLGIDRDAALAVPGVRDVVEIPSGIAVLADTTHAAFAGRAALAVRWDQEGRLDVDGASAAARLAALAREGTGVEAERRGDALRLLADGKAIDAEYSAPYLAHATMEPMNASARPVGGRLEVAAPVQNPHGAAQAAAGAAGLDPSQVDVSVTFLGGGFGRRAENDVVEEAAALASRTGRPVQVVWDRRDDFLFDFHRPAAHHRIRAAVGADGLPRAWAHRIAAPSIVAQRVPLDRPVDPTAVEGAVDLPYELGARLVEWVPADLGVRVGFWRSVGHSHNAFAVESFVDELAERAGEDGMAYRLRLLAKRPRERALLEQLAERAGWRDALGPGMARGVALHSSFGSHVAVVAEAASTPVGPRVTRLVAAVDCGRLVHPDLVRAQMEGGLLFGLSAALFEAVELERGAVASAGFERYRVLRLGEEPTVEVHLLPNGDAPGGIGEVAVPPVAPAVASAFFHLDGRRRRGLPLGG